MKDLRRCYTKRQWSEAPLPIAIRMLAPESGVSVKSAVAGT